MRLDLHLHTTCSDGLLTPEALVLAARRAGLGAIAVTDHDTADGVAPAIRAAASAGGPMVIAGVELTTSHQGREVHLLGYGVDAAHRSLTEFTAHAAALRRERLAEIVARLKSLGIELNESEVAPGEGGPVGRPHIARALVRKRVVSSLQEAFARFLADGAPAFVPSRGLDLGLGIEAVRRAGGLPVWAHPDLADASRFGELAERGLGGVETLRPAVDPPVSVALEQEARAHGLCVTGGSDWHGQQRPALGSFYVTEKHVRAFLERLGINPAL
jgi:predicted metal-dependent phosphoesterase TrpH